MLEHITDEFAGKVVRAVRTIPRQTDCRVPFLFHVEFTDGSVVSLSAHQVDGHLSRPDGHDAIFQFPG